MLGENPGSDLTVLLVSGTLVMVFLIAVIIISMVIYQKKVMREQKRIQELELERAYNITNAILSTQDEERQRIAQDLHDELGSMIFSLKIKMGELADDNEKLIPEIEANEALIDQIAGRVRSISHDMMPPALKHRELSRAVKSLAEAIGGNSQLIIDVTDNSNERHLPRDVQVTLYRVISEWLNNLIKHSGANQVNIDLTSDGRQYAIRLTDNGKAFDFEKALYESKGLGLKGIVGRLQQIHATYSYRQNSTQNNIFEFAVSLNDKYDGGAH